MLADFERFELYYDSSVEGPKEDPDALLERIRTLAERNGFEYDAVDLSDRDAEEVSQLRRDLASSVRAGREYVVDGRVFSDETFGRIRPVLAVRYADADGIDLYPHRSNESTARLTRVGDFLDEVDASASTDRSAYGELEERERESDEGTDARGESESRVGPDVPDAPVDRRSVLAGMAGTGAVAGTAMLVGLKNVPVVGALVDCGPGETKIEEISDDAVGTTVEIRGVIDYSLDDTTGFTAFQLDGQTGTVPVYLAGNPERELAFGDCLHVRGTVTSGDEKPVDGPVVSDATLLDG